MVKYFNIDASVDCAYSAISKDGYHSPQETNPTKDTVLSMLNARPEHTPLNNKDMVAKIIVWASNINPKNDYMEKIHNIAAYQDEVSQYELGLVCSMVNTYLKYNTPDTQQMNISQINPVQYNIGERITIDVSEVKFLYHK